MKLFFVLIFNLLFLNSAYSAACCSVGGTSTPIMTEQTQLEMRVGTSRSKVVAERFESDQVLFWDTERDQVTTMLNTSINYRLGEDWQIATSLDYIYRNYEFNDGKNETSGRLGDARILVAYELIYPSPAFSWRPQAFVSLEQTLFRGRGLEESQLDGLADISGSDQYSTALGLHLFKRGYRTMWSFESRYTHFHPKRFESVNLKSRAEYNLSLGLQSIGLSEYFELGTSWSVFFIDGRRRDQGINSPSERYYEVSLYSVLNLSPNTGLILSYADQTLLGPVKNTTLSRRLGLSFNYSLQR